MAVVLDSGVSLFPHYFARIPCRIWRKNGNEKPRLHSEKKRAKYPMRLVIRRQSRINSRFADKPRKAFPSPLFPSISCSTVQGSWCSNTHAGPTVKSKSYFHRRDVFNASDYNYITRTLFQVYNDWFPCE